ncbi:MAG: histidine phosphatase family protein [Patescibacteria group bacterium]
MFTKSSRENLESLFLRHGDVLDISTYIEKGEKPPYELLVKFMRGETDPPIDKESSTKLIQEKISSGEIKKGDFDIIICSSALRGRQTAELVRGLVDADIEVHPSDYLKEVKFPMDDITPEYYEQAKDMSEVRNKFIDSFLNGNIIDEGPVDVYKRANNFLTYLRRINKYTNRQPLFISHGFFARTLDLAISYQDEKFTDEQIAELMRKEFTQTKRPKPLGGFRLLSSSENTNIISII